MLWNRRLGIILNFEVHALCSNWLISRGSLSVLSQNREVKTLLLYWLDMKVSLLVNLMVNKKRLLSLKLKKDLVKRRVYKSQSSRSTAELILSKEIRKLFSKKVKESFIIAFNYCIVKRCELFLSLEVEVKSIFRIMGSDTSVVTFGKY